MTRHRTLDEIEQIDDRPWIRRGRWRMGSIPAPGKTGGQPHPREEPGR